MLSRGLQSKLYRFEYIFAFLESGLHSLSSKSNRSGKTKFWERILAEYDSSNISVSLTNSRNASRRTLIPILKMKSIAFYLLHRLPKPVALLLHLGPIALLRLQYKMIKVMKGIGRRFLIEFKKMLNNVEHIFIAKQQVNVF